MKEMESVMYGSYTEIFNKVRQLSAEFGGLPFDSLANAFSLFGTFYSDPYVQNRRVKRIASSPIPYGKDDVAKMLKDPDNCEKGLRETAHYLEVASYPFYHIRKTYSSLLTYHNYIAPVLTDKSAMESDAFWREYKLVEKIRKTFKPDEFAHRASGQAQQEGKVFYTYRIETDKPRNRVYHALAQQLPSDWCKIVGFNNKSKYTVAFDMMYFTTGTGADPMQFGDLFIPYLREFNKAVFPAPKGTGTKLIYASNAGIKLDEVDENKVEAYYQNGRWYYWVILPIEKVHVIEADDVATDVFSPFAGLFINMIQLSQLEALQLQLYQNPLIGFLTGEMETYNDRGTMDSDPVKLSESFRKLFVAIWNKVLAEYNTGGIPAYFAPMRDLRLQTFNEVNHTSEIVSQGIEDTMAEAGLSAIIPSSSDTRAGAVQTSFKIEGRFLSTVYDGVERLFNCMLESQNLKYEWEFKMFGSLAEDEETEKRALTGMQNGMLSDLMIYNAVRDKSLLDDMCYSELVIASGIMDNRIPLQTSYTQSAKGEQNEIGRPSNEGEAKTEGSEGDIDSVTVEE